MSPLPPHDPPRQDRAPRDRRARRLASRLLAWAGLAAFLALVLDTDLAWYLSLGPFVEGIPPGSSPVGIGATLAFLLGAWGLHAQRRLAREVDARLGAALAAGALATAALGAVLLLLRLPLGPFGAPLQALLGILVALGAARIVLGIVEQRGPVRGARIAREALPLLAILGFAATYLGLRGLAHLDPARNDLADYAFGLVLVGGLLAVRGHAAWARASRLPSASEAQRHVQQVRALPDPEHAAAADTVGGWLERGEGAERYEALVLRSLRAAQLGDGPARDALREAQTAARRREPDAAREARIATHRRILQLLEGTRAN